MDVDSCIKAYVDMSDRIFRKAHDRLNTKGKIQGRFDVQEFERAAKRIVTDNGLKEDSLLMDETDAPCKV